MRPSFVEFKAASSIRVFTVRARLAVLCLLLASCLAAHAMLSPLAHLHAMAAGPQQLAFAGLHSIELALAVHTAQPGKGQLLRPGGHCMHYECSGQRGVNCNA